MPAPRRHRVLPALALLLAASSTLAAGCGTTNAGAPGDDPRRAAADDTMVLAISVDGLMPKAIRVLGDERAPVLNRLLRQGASTRNARTQVEQTVTLPNHTSMVTGRRIAAAHNGHGVTWNSDLPGTTVQKAAGENVRSVFNVVHASGGSTAIFAAKSKFSLFDRSWPAAVDRSVIKEQRDRAVVRAARRDLVGSHRAFTFLHIGRPDQIGHARGWMSPAYLDAVALVDRLLGTVVRVIKGNASLSNVVIVLTADHGGVPGTRDHGNEKRLANYRVPFLVWGNGVDRGDLYAMNPTLADPGRKRVLFDGPQPVRNGMVANLSLDLLGLGPVPDSRWNYDQAVTWKSPA